jgi:acetyl esterase/lipase
MSDATFGKFFPPQPTEVGWTHPVLILRNDEPTVEGCPQCAKLTAERDRLQTLLNEYAEFAMAKDREVQMLRQRLDPL